MDRVIKQPFFTIVRIGWIAAGMVVIAGILILTVQGKKPPVQNLSTASISIGTISKGVFQETIPLDGTVLPLRIVYLDAVESGRIEARFAEEGQLVQEGQKLLQLSNPQLQLDLMNREELLANERTNLANTRFVAGKERIALIEQLDDNQFELVKAARKFNQDSLLINSGAISSTEFRSSREDYDHLKKKRLLLEEKLRNEKENSAAQLNQYQASIELKQQNLNIVRSSLERLILRAPATGQLTMFKAEVGEYKNKGQQLGQLDIPNGFKIRAGVDEHYISRVATGEQAALEFAGKQYTLTVKTIYPQVTNGRFDADLEFTSGTPVGIKKGQSLQLQLSIGGQKETLLLPRGSFYQQTGGNWIYVLSKDGKTAEKREIKLGQQNTGYYELISGLNAGDRVIISSYDGIGDFQFLTLN